MVTPELKVEYDPITGLFKSTFDSIGAVNWLSANTSFIKQSHNEARNYADTYVSGVDNKAYLKPGTPEFEAAFNKIISTKSNKRTDDEAGTKFFDKSALYHAQAEYKFEPTFCRIYCLRR